MRTRFPMLSLLVGAIVGCGDEAYRLGGGREVSDGGFGGVLGQGGVNAGGTSAGGTSVGGTSTGGTSVGGTSMGGAAAALGAAGLGDIPDGSADASDAQVPNGRCTQTPGSIGEYLLTIAFGPFPTKPTLMWATTEVLNDGWLTLTIRHFDYSRTRLVGNPVVMGPIRLQTDGYFRTDQLLFEVPGEANCALPDTAVTVALTFEGGPICDQTAFACGMANGTVLGLGVDLNGSTFTARRIENGVVPQPELNCGRVGQVENCK